MKKIMILVLVMVTFNIAKSEDNHMDLTYGTGYLIGEFFNPVTKNIFVFTAHKSARDFTEEFNKDKFATDPKTGIYTMLGVFPTLSDYAQLEDKYKAAGTYVRKGEYITLTYNLGKDKTRVRLARLIGKNNYLKFLDTNEIYVKYMPQNYQP